MDLSSEVAFMDVPSDDKQLANTNSNSSTRQSPGKRSSIMDKQSNAFSGLRRTQIYLRLLSDCDFPVKFVALDAEAFEFNQNIITEVGLSSLYTDDLQGISPGSGAIEWTKKIEAKHYRIIEYASYVNKRFVTGCPEKFNFGKSEWIPKDAVGAKVAQSLCASRSTDTGTEDASRVVLVGHNVKSDIKYMESLGINMRSLISDCIDTQELWKAVKRSNNGTALGRILAQHNVETMNLHNAGNDAFYTLQVLLAMALEDAMYPVPEEHWEESKKEAIRIACEEATRKVELNFQSWSAAADAFRGHLDLEDLRASANIGAYFATNSRGNTNSTVNSPTHSRCASTGNRASSRSTISTTSRGSDRAARQRGQTSFEQGSRRSRSSRQQGRGSLDSRRGHRAEGRDEMW